MKALLSFLFIVSVNYLFIQNKTVKQNHPASNTNYSNKNDKEFPSMLTIKDVIQIQEKIADCNLPYYCKINLEKELYGLQKKSTNQYIFALTENPTTQLKTPGEYSITTPKFDYFFTINKSGVLSGVFVKGNAKTDVIIEDAIFSNGFKLLHKSNTEHYFVQFYEEKNGDFSDILTINHTKADTTMAISYYKQTPYHLVYTTGNTTIQGYIPRLFSTRNHKNLQQQIHPLTGREFDAMSKYKSFQNAYKEILENQRNFRLSLNDTETIYFAPPEQLLGNKNIETNEDKHKPEQITNGEQIIRVDSPPPTPAPIRNHKVLENE